jgi:endonuclease YncB( thermonuclease family)
MTGFDHDYKNYPELTNTELQVLGLTSPHKQIIEDFTATVVKVHDGDTITLRIDERDFDFPLRILDINAPELNENGGYESQAWLASKILGQEVMILINTYNRVDKYGRLLGHVMHMGMSMGEIMVINGMATLFENRREGQIPSFDKYISEVKI